MTHIATLVAERDLVKVNADQEKRTLIYQGRTTTIPQIPLKITPPTPEKVFEFLNMCDTSGYRGFNDWTLNTTYDMPDSSTRNIDMDAALCTWCRRVTMKLRRGFRDDFHLFMSASYDGFEGVGRAEVEGMTVPRYPESRG